MAVKENGGTGSKALPAVQKPKGMWKNRTAYGVFLGVTGILYLWLRTTESQIMFFALLFLPILSYIIAWLGRRKLQITQDTDCAAAPKGTPASFWVRLENKGRLPIPYIRLCYHTDQSALRYTPAPTLCGLSVGESRRVEAQVSAKYRGRYSVGADAVYVEDYLRIFRLRCPLAQRPEVVFLPALVSVSLPDALRGVSDSRVPVPGAVEDYSSVAEILPYDPSREFRKIHWKLTARMDELMVRQFETEETARATLLLDLSPLGEGEKGAALEDVMIESAVSLLNALMQNDRPAGFLYGLDQPVLLQENGRAGFENYYRLAAGLPFTGRWSAGELLSYYLGKRSSGAVLLLTGRVDEPLLAAIAEALAGGVQVGLFLLQDDRGEESTSLAALEERGVSVTRFGLRRRIHTALDPAGRQGVG